MTLTPIDVILKGHYLYLSGMTLSQVAKELGLRSGTTILYHFQRNNLPRRKRGGAIKQSQSGSCNGNWQGGRTISKSKVRVWEPSHPNSQVNGYVYEHILIATKALGRPLKKGEIVHHIDQNPLNNANNNLLICTQNYHMYLHKTLRWRQKNGRNS